MWKFISFCEFGSWGDTYISLLGLEWYKGLRGSTPRCVLSEKFWVLLFTALCFVQYLLIFHFDEFLCVHVWSGQRQDGDGTLHTVILSQFTVKTKAGASVNSAPLFPCMSLCHGGSSALSARTRTWSSLGCTGLCSFHSERHRSHLWGRACATESACSSVWQSHSVTGFPLVGKPKMKKECELCHHLADY